MNAQQEFYVGTLDGVPQFVTKSADFAASWVWQNAVNGFECPTTHYVGTNIHRAVEFLSCGWEISSNDSMGQRLTANKTKEEM